MSLLVGMGFIPPSRAARIASLNREGFLSDGGPGDTTPRTRQADITPPEEPGEPSRTLRAAAPTPRTRKIPSVSIAQVELLNRAFSSDGGRGAVPDYLEAIRNQPEIYAGIAGLSAEQIAPRLVKFRNNLPIPQWKKLAGDAAPRPAPAQPAGFADELAAAAAKPRPPRYTAPLVERAFDTNPLHMCCRPADEQRPKPLAIASERLYELPPEHSHEWPTERPNARPNKHSAEPKPDEPFELELRWQRPRIEPSTAAWFLDREPPPRDPVASPIRVASRQPARAAMRG